MSGSDVRFHNKATIRVQAQIYSGATLISSCVAGPGETHTLAAPAEQYDIYFKNGATGWQIARMLNSKATAFTLSQTNGHFILT